MRRPAARIRGAICVTAALLTLSACSGDDPGSGASRTSAAPSRTPGAAAPVRPGQLLVPVAAYVEAVNGKDLEALVRAFAPDGQVVDVGRTFTGREAIRRWADAEVMGGTLTVNRVVESRAGYQKLLVRFAPGGTGGFAAHYAFTVSGSTITRADLTYAD